MLRILLVVGAADDPIHRYWQKRSWILTRQDNSPGDWKCWQECSRHSSLLQHHYTHSAQHEPCRQEEFLSRTKRETMFSLWWQAFAGLLSLQGSNLQFLPKNWPYFSNLPEKERYQKLLDTKTTSSLLFQETPLWCTNFSISPRKKMNPLMVLVGINDSWVEMEIDTGTAVSLISCTVFDTLAGAW